MNEPVDLTNLRSMTDGDAEMEKALFEEFFSSFESGMASLENNMAQNNAEEWRKQAHGLKGISLNLGAAALAAHCEKAQNEPLADAGAKNELLKKIQTEYKRVKQFLLKIVAA